VVGAGGQLKLNSGNDTTLAGAQAQGRTVVAEVGGNLTLESKQNTTYSRGQDAGLSIGSSRVGINGGNRNQRRRWTDDPTSLIGTESVTVNVNSDTRLTGALLAQINEDGTDGGNLALNTRNLTYKDLVDTDNSSNWSAGFSTGMRWSTPPKQKKDGAKTRQEKADTQPKKGKDFPNSSTTSLQASLNGYVRGQLTRATLGQGSLSLRERAGVRGDLTSLNRNIDTFQTVTANRNTGGLNVDVTVDHRMGSKEGWKLIKNDFVVTAQHGREMAQSVKDVVSQKQLGTLDYFRQVKDYATERETLALHSQNEALHKKLTGEKGASGNRKGLQETSDVLTKAHGLNETATVWLYDGVQTPDDTPVNSPNDFNMETANAGYYEKDRDIFINVNGKDIDMTNSATQIGAVVHENARHQYAQEGRNYDIDTETYLASQRRKLAESVWSYNTNLNGYGTTNSSLNRDGWLNTNRASTTVTAGSGKIRPLDSRDIKPLQSIGIFGGNQAQASGNESPKDSNALHVYGDSIEAYLAKKREWLTRVGTDELKQFAANLPIVLTDKAKQEKIIEHKGRIEAALNRQYGIILNEGVVAINNYVKNRDGNARTKIYSAGQPEKVTDSIVKDYKKDELIILYGHSAGGGDVQDVAQNLKEKGINNIITIQVDSVEPFGDDASIPSNVKSAINIYQKQSGDINDFRIREKDNIDIYLNRGKENISGYLIRGEDNISADDPKKTSIINKEVTHTLEGPARQKYPNNPITPHRDIDNDPKVQQYIIKQVEKPIAEAVKLESK